MTERMREVSREVKVGEAGQSSGRKTSPVCSVALYHPPDPGGQGLSLLGEHQDDPALAPDVLVGVSCW